MKKANSDIPISIEEAKKLFEVFTEPSDTVRSSIWDAHWRNARNAVNETQLLNMLKNHERLFEGKPSGSGFVCEPDHSDERTQIVKFIKNRLKNEFSVITNESSDSLQSKIQSAQSRAAAQQSNQNQPVKTPER